MHNLRSGATQSCGCRKSRSKAVVPGAKYGRLTTVERRGWLGGEPAFLFRCECGVEKVIVAQSVRRGITKSCGCLRSEVSVRLGSTNPHPGRDGKAHIRYYYKGYKARAHHKGIAFSLTLEQFHEIILADCCYCGSPPAVRDVKRYGSYAVNGIDRKDSGGAYTLENCVPCCPKCNYGKNVMNVDEFKDWVCAVHTHLAL